MNEQREDEFTIDESKVKDALISIGPENLGITIQVPISNIKLVSSNI